MNNNNSKDILNDIPIKEEFLIQHPHSHKRKKRRKPKLWVLVTIFLFLTAVFSYSTTKIFKWNRDNKKTSHTIQNIANDIKVKEIKEPESEELINEPLDKTNDYWYYITFPLVEVNFDELIKKNKDTIAWIQVNNTNVNYPIVQSNNNEYYLNHSYDKSLNEAGWVFMDFRNNANFHNKNTIIYAHSRLDKTMFGSLSKVLKNTWYQNKDNHIIKISTPTENSLWQIFSVYKIKEETYYITTDFSTTEQYLKFLNTLKNRSKYNFQTELNENDQILTLSTCYSDTERTVIHAKKIKKSTRTS